MANLLNYLIPEGMQAYLSYFGMNFNKNLYEFAVKMMRKENSEGELEEVKPMSAEQLKTMLAKYKIELSNNDLYNALYIAAMVKADYWGSSIEDEAHMARYIEDTLCDVDAAEGQTFARFVADCAAKGIVIFWEQMIDKDA